jgi:hypothetical protein
MVYVTATVCVDKRLGYHRSEYAQEKMLEQELRAQQWAEETRRRGTRKASPCLSKSSVSDRRLVRRLGCADAPETLGDSVVF